MVPSEHSPHAFAPGDSEVAPADDYARAARAALKNKDAGLAIEQACAAVAQCPHDDGYLRLLDEAIARSRKPLVHLALPDDGAFFGLCAGRARALARIGRIDEALHTLAQAVVFRPSIPFFEWARGWVETKKRRFKVDPSALAETALMIADAANDHAFEPGLKRNLEATLWVVKKQRRRQPVHAALQVAECRLLRVLGRHAQALRLFDEPLATSDLWQSAVEAAALCRELGDFEAQTRWLERARVARPDDPAASLDLGDGHLDNGDTRQAIEAYDQALLLEPSSVWASASRAYANALAQPGEGTSLPAVAVDTPSVSRRRVAALRADLAVYRERLAEPSDPLIGVLRRLYRRAAAAELPANSPIGVRSERPMAPSARLALNYGLQYFGCQARLVVEHDVLHPQFGPLWHESTLPSPAVEPPPRAVSELVARLASTAFGWQGWCEAAQELRSALVPPQRLSLQALCATMAYPPEPPSRDHDPVTWIHGYQVAAAILVAQEDGGVEARFDMLGGLLAATDDWSSAAAAMGLRALAEQHPAMRAAVGDQLRARIPTHEEPLAPMARAVAVAGAAITKGRQRAAFLRLRARARNELDPP